MRLGRRLIIAITSAAMLASCQSLVGPASIAPDRINYADAMVDS
jgi:hypothetical protein